MPVKLSAEEIVALKVLSEKGQSNSEIAQALGVSEGTVRYHLRRQGQPDGRKNKTRKAEALAEVIDLWLSQLVYDPQASPTIHYEASARLRAGVWNCRKLPFPINELSASVSVRDGRITIERAGGVKCERCWRYVTSVSSDPAWEGLCERCQGALAEPIHG